MGKPEGSTIKSKTYALILSLERLRLITSFGTFNFGYIYYETPGMGWAQAEIIW
jgi:hypothetical protein